MASQLEIVTFAVYLLGGDRKFVDTEDVAIKAHELAPGRFCWRKYKDQISLDAVRVSLSNAKQRVPESFIKGYGTKGWGLTPDGLKWVIQNLGALEGDLTAPESSTRGGSVDSKRVDRERRRLLSSRAWGAWSQDQYSVTVEEAKEVFRIDSYTTGEMLQTKKDRLINMFIDDQDISRFLGSIEKLI